MGHIPSLRPRLLLLHLLPVACLAEPLASFFKLLKSARDVRIDHLQPGAVIRFKEAETLRHPVLTRLPYASPALRHAASLAWRRQTYDGGPVPLCFVQQPYCELTLKLVTVWAATVLSLCWISSRDWPPV